MRIAALPLSAISKWTAAFEYFLGCAAGPTRPDDVCALRIYPADTIEPAEPSTLARRSDAVFF
jgi:hypothetical protein